VHRSRRQQASAFPLIGGEGIEPIFLEVDAVAAMSVDAVSAEGERRVEEKAYRRVAEELQIPVGGLHLERLIKRRVALAADGSREVKIGAGMIEDEVAGDDASAGVIAGDVG
jgi:hypothetical protein